MDFVSAAKPKPALEPTHSPIQQVMGFISLGVWS